MSVLTQKFCPPLIALSSREIEGMLSGAMPELMPKHFMAMSIVDGFCRSFVPHADMSDGDFIACYYLPIGIDDSSLRASWWFGVYCGEDWALKLLKDDSSLPSREFGELVRSLPILFRQIVVKHGVDPVQHVKREACRLPSSSILSRQRFIDWMLEYDTLGLDEGRIGLAFAMTLLADFGCLFESIGFFDDSIVES